MAEITSYFHCNKHTLSVKSKLPAGHNAIGCAPPIIAHCPPLSTEAHLHMPFKHGGAASAPYAVLYALRTCQQVESKFLILISNYIKFNNCTIFFLRQFNCSSSTNWKPGICTNNTSQIKISIDNMKCTAFRETKPYIKFYEPLERNETYSMGCTSHHYSFFFVFLTSHTNIFCMCAVVRRCPSGISYQSGL